MAYYNIYEYYNTGRDGNYNLFGNTWGSQTFTPSTSHTLRFVRLQGGKIGTFTKAMFSIRATSGGVPTGPDLAYTEILYASLPSSGTWFDVIFSTPVSVVAGTTYAIVARSTGTSSSKCLLWDHDSAGATYAGGSEYISTNGGASWTIQTGKDFMFEEGDDYYYVTTSAATGVTKDQATGNGTVTSFTGGLAVLDEYGFDYGIVSYGSEVTVVGTPSSPFSQTIPELYPSSYYYYRAKVHHPTYGWITGNGVGFFTSVDPDLLLYEKQNTVDSLNQEFYGVQWRTQTFTPAISHLIRSVRMKWQKYGSGEPGLIYVSIRATDGAGKPTGSDLANGYYLGSWVTTGTPAWYEIGLGAGIVLSATVKYAIVCRAPSGTTSNYIRWRCGSGYAGGQYGSSADSGVTWTMNAIFDEMFEDKGLSGVETFPATEITQYTAIGNGSLLVANNVNEIGFEWGITHGGPYPDDTTVTGYIEPGMYNLPITGLTAETPYYYRAKVYDTVLGWLYGDEEAFTTLSPLPLVETNTPSDVGSTYILAQGEVTSIGGATVDERGFVYGLTSQATPGNVAPGSSGYTNYNSSTGSFGVGVFYSNLSGLTTNKKYYIRAYAHNSYGYKYGDEIIAYTGVTVSILYPNSDYSIGIRFDTAPGEGYPKPHPHEAPPYIPYPHYVLCQDEDSVYVPGGIWGYVTGNYVYEHSYYNSNMYTDLYGMSNPSRRTEGIVKIKWKGRVLKNSYPYGNYQRQLRTHGVTYSGTKSSIGSPSGSTKCEIFYTNLYTGGAWTLAEADSIIAGISIGDEASFGIAICDAVKVVVLWANAYARTDPSTWLSETSYRLNGYVTEDEGEDCEVWFQWGPTSGFGSVTAHQDKAKGDSFSADITASGEIYFRTAILTACGETFYGNTRTTTQQPITLPLRGLFIRGDEIQATFSISGISKPYRSPDFGATWYPVAGMDDVHTGDVGFDSRNVQNSFFGGSGHLYVFDNAVGEEFTYVQGAAITGDVDQVDVDLDLPIALIATNLKLYKTVDWGNVVYEMLNQPIRDVAFGGVSLAPEPQMELLTPTGDGEYRQLTPIPSTPTTHHDKVLDADSKKCYNPQGGYGGYGEWGYNGRLADTYFFTNLRGEGTINNITVYATLGVASALMSRNFILRLNGVNYFSGFSTIGGGTVSYTWATNPATGNPWQKSEIQNGTFQAGVIISDTGVPSGCWIDKIWIVVDWV